MTSLYDSVINIEDVIYTVEAIEEFQIVPMVGGRPFIVVVKVHLRPSYTSDVFSSKNVVELESDLDDRRN